MKVSNLAPAFIPSLRLNVARRAVRLALLAQAAAQQRGAPPDLTGTASFELPFGTIALDARDSVIKPTLETLGTWDPGGTAFTGRHAKPGMTVLDIGAHVGYHACHAGRLVGPTGLVLAFEPEPRNYELLLANVWRNGLHNVVCFPWAVTDRSGFAELYLHESNTGDHRLFDDGGRSAVTVRTVRVDDTLTIRPPVDIVKIDVQGAERAAVAGMEALLAHSPSVRLILEFWPHGIRARGEDPLETLAYYRALGFALRARTINEQDAVEMTDAEILASCSGDDELYVDLELARS